jgi:hypothetical protein
MAFSGRLVHLAVAAIARDDLWDAAVISSA